MTAEDKSIEARSLRPGMAARAVVADGRAIRDAIEAVLAAPEESREVARRAYEAVRDQIVADALDVMPVDQLRDLVGGKVTFAPLIDAGLDTVGKVLAAGPEALRRIPRVRRRTAKRIMAAAARRCGSPSRMAPAFAIDPDVRTPEHTGRTRRRAAAAVAGAPGHALKGPGPQARWRARSGAASASRPPAAPRSAGECASRSPGGRSRKPVMPSASCGRHPQLQATVRHGTQAWPGQGRRLSWRRQARNGGSPGCGNDYLARPVTYNGLLIEVYAELDPAREASQGFLPADIRRSASPRCCPLTSPCSRHRCAASTRHVRREVRAGPGSEVILGDEMGLGKTMESLAAMCRTTGGQGRDRTSSSSAARRAWSSTGRARWSGNTASAETRRLPHLPGARSERAQPSGVGEPRAGVAVTTFEALRVVLEARPWTILDRLMMVVDEAHYAKNPNAVMRTQAG